MLEDNLDVTLVNVIAPGKTLNVPHGYTGTLTLQNTLLGSINGYPTNNGGSTTYALGSTEPEALHLAIEGDVVVEATTAGTSAITAKRIFITGDGTLTAIGNGTHGFGIGGMDTEEIYIEGVHIKDVRGSYVQPHFIKDVKYGKSEEEGGAAIGSGFSGAKITLKNVEIDNVQGGKYGAAVGTGYHVAAIEGNIECDVNGTPGESRTDKYTVAQVVGFGVVDHEREVKYVDGLELIYKGNVIAVPNAQ